MNKPVSFPLAKLLKEKGFDEPCKLCVEDGDERPLPFNCGNTIHRNSLHPYYSAPTISDVIMWLYKNHKIWIRVDIEGEKFNIFYFLAYRNHEERIKEYMKKLNDENYHTNYKTPKEAYEAGIEHTLNNLI